MATGSDLVKKALSTDYYSGKGGGAFAAIDVASVVTAQNKVSALLGVLRSLVAFNLLGWAGSVAGGFIGIRTVLTALIRDSGTVEAALRSLSKIQFSTNQLAPFIGGAKEARLRVIELMREAGRPFKLDQLVAATRSLLVLTQGSYSSQAALKSVGNAATAADQDLAETASRVGGVIAAARDGQPVGELADELASMGVISWQAARRLVELQNSGAPLAQTISTLQGEFDKAAGASRRAAGEVAGLQSRYETAKAAVGAGFGAAFAKSEQSGLTNTAKALENLAPVATAVAGPLSQVITIGNNFLSWLAKTASGLSFLPAVASVATRSFIGLGLAAAAVTAYRLGEAMVPLAKSVYGFADAIRTGTLQTEAATAAENLLSRAATNVAMAETLSADAAEIRAAAGEALTVEQAAEAASLERTATGLTAQSFALRATAAASGPAATGITVLTSGFRSLAAAILLNPVTWIVVALTLLIGVTSHLVAAHQEHVKALNDLKHKGDDVVGTLQAQAAAMRTADDQTQLLTKSTNELIEAKKALADLEAKGAPKDLVDAAQRNVARIAAEREKIKDATGLAPSEKQRQLEENRAQQALAERDAEYQAKMSLATPGEQARLRAEEIARQRANVEKGKGLQDAETSTAAADSKFDEDIRDKADTGSNIDAALGISGKDDAEKDRKRARKQAELLGKRADAEAQLANARKNRRHVNDTLDMYLDPKVEGQLNLLDQYGTATNEKAKLEDQKRQLRRNPQANEIIRGYAQIEDDLNGKRIDPSEASRRRIALDTRRKELLDAADNGTGKVTALTAEQRAAERSRKSSEIDVKAEEEIAAIHSRGLDAAEAEAAINIHQMQAQLDLARRLGTLDDLGIRSAEAKIAARQRDLDLMRQQASQQRESDASRIAVTKLEQQAALATAQGRFADAARLRDERNRVSDEAARRESIQSKVASGSYSQTQAEAAAREEQAQREAERANRRQIFLDTHNRELDIQALSQSRSPGDRLKAKEAEDVNKARGRISEALDAGVTPQEAAAYAKRAGLLDLQREQLNSGRNTVADSLQRIGGGGNASGGDPSLEINRRKVSLLASMDRSLEILVGQNKNNGDNTMQPTVFSNN